MGGGEYQILLRPSNFPFPFGRKLDVVVLRCLGSTRFQAVLDDRLAQQFDPRTLRLCCQSLVQARL